MANFGVRLAALFIIAMAFLVIWQAHSKPAELNKPVYGLRAGNIWLETNQDARLYPDVDENGWASVQLWVDPHYYHYEAQRTNGSYEPVTCGSSVLTTDCNTTRIIKVYCRGEKKLFTKHIIAIFPRG